jgi:hypothetical protein
MAHRDAEPVTVVSGPIVDFVNSLYMLLVSDIINNFYMDITIASDSHSGLYMFTFNVLYLLLFCFSYRIPLYCRFFTAGLFHYMFRPT